MIHVDQIVNILGYEGSISCDRKRYYVYFKRAHRIIIQDIEKELLRIYSNNNTLDYIASTLKFDKQPLCLGLFPEFYSLSDLEKFINFLNKFNLINIR